MDSGNISRGRYKNRPIEKAEGMKVSTWPDISYLSIQKPELVNVLRQMGQLVKWPQKMKPPDSFRNPGISIDKLVEPSTDYSIGISINAFGHALMRGLNVLTKLPRSALALL
ncbi:hypothetical protein F2Q69_00058936 [Brassica cretica]|uniref:Uncharacterized protein n=1 Tax=Brassica cretica TaxID=69181 RepID=A0A8S9RH86_BRACR|nr:hypothetical protein F2Q69_00058936 [Brassica cretica]